MSFIEKLCHNLKMCVFLLCQRCRHYAYIDLTSFPSSRCSSGHYNGERTQLYDNQAIVDALKTADLALINNRQV